MNDALSVRPTRTATDGQTNLKNRAGFGVQHENKPGGMAEWSKATVLKAVVPLAGPGVRIPLPPPFYPPKTKKDSPLARKISSRILITE